jgi:hypothetical protein
MVVLILVLTLLAIGFITGFIYVGTNREKYDQASIGILFQRLK